MGAAACVGAMVVATSSQVRAGGFEVPAVGTVGIGRGGALVARADNLSAFHYNPAGLAKLSGPNVLLSGNVVRLSNRFTRRGSGERLVPPGNENGADVLDPSLDVNTGDPYATVENAAKFGPSPLFVVSWGDVGVKGLSLQFGLAAPVGFGSHDWPRQGSQRYTITTGDFSFFALGGGVSYRLNRYFSVGANFLAGRFSADFQLKTRTGATGAMSNEDFNGDATTTVVVADKFVPSANFGVLSQPLRFLEVGLSVRLPYRTQATGTLDYSPSMTTPDATLASAARVELRQTFPTVLRAGARFIHERFDLELDYVFENYGVVDGIDVQFSNPDSDFTPDQFDDTDLLYLDTFGSGVAFAPIIATPPPLQFRNTHQLRLGSDVEVLPGHLTVRAGGFVASSAYPKGNTTYTIRFPFSDQLGVGGGLTWHMIPQLDLSAGYLHIFQRDVTVERGISQANAFRFPGDPNIYGNIVNNGKYEMSLELFGLSIEVHPLRGSRPRRQKGTKT
ncbi:MAG: outer membrane protein transport protein [Nannocystaceae bacterium]|nr:outer membrane protein transport protein [Nannocystaceae bacterium]